MAEMVCYTVLFEQIRNMILKQVNRTPFKFQNESSTSPESQNHRIERQCLKSGKIMFMILKSSFGIMFLIRVNQTHPWIDYSALHKFSANIHGP